jgi:hypothetical protein
MTRTKSSRALLSVVLAVLMVAAFMPALTYSSFAATAKKATKVTKLNHRGGTVYAKVGNKYTLKYSLSPSKLTSAAKKTAWKTSDKNVVKIIAVNGRHATIKAKQNGYANVKVYCKNNHKAQATWRIKVSKKATEIVINTDKVQKEYGLATKYNKVKTDLTKSDLLNGVVATVNGKEVKLTEDNVTIGDPINKKIIKTTENYAEMTEATYPITYKVTAADGTVGTKTINVTVENQAPVLNTQDVTVAINKTKETTKATITDQEFVNKAIKSVDDYESFASDAKDKSLKAWTDLTAKNTSTGKNKVEITKVVNADGKDITGTVAGQKLSNIRVAEATTYTVTVKATDFLGATTTKDVKLTVQANQAPTIATDSVKLTKNTSVSNLKEQIFNQLTYNDAEDGQGVAANKTNNGYDGFHVEFEDSDTNKLFDDSTTTTVTAAELAKVKNVVVTGLKDQDGASAQAKRLSVSFVDAPVITIKDNEGTTADTARVYIPYVSENTHQAVMTLADAYKYVSAKYDGADVKLITAADKAADDAAVKKNNPKASSDLVVNLTSDRETGTAFSLDPRVKGDTETVNFTVTIKDPTTKQTVTTTQKVVFKVVDSADKAAQIAYDKSVDAKTAKPSTDSKTVYDDNGKAVDKSAVDALNKVTFTTDTTSTKDRVVLIVNNAPKGATFAWSYNGAAKSDQTKNSITVDPEAYPGTYVVTVTYDGLTATHTYTVK